jgi:hypothetical protein
MKLDDIEDIDDLMSELGDCFKKDRHLHNKIDALQAKLDKNEKRKASLAYKLYQQFIKNNIGRLNEQTPYYYAFLDDNDSADIVVMRLKYDQKYIPGYSERYAVFTSAGMSKLNVNMKLNLDPEEYETAKVVIDQEQLDQLKRVFSVKYID